MQKDDDEAHAAPKTTAGEGGPGPDEQRVGYANPPKATRFRPGQSGNPNGRPKGSHGRKKILERVLLELHDVVEGGEPKQRTTLELILLMLRNRSFEGDPKAFKAFQDLDARFGPREATGRVGYIVVPERLTEEEWEALYSPKDEPIA
jgi:hypothetical protein